MSDIHRIEIQVDSRDAVNASRNLNLLGGSVATLTGGIQNLGRYSATSTSAIASLSGGVSGISRTMQEASISTQRLNSQLEQTHQRSTIAAGSLGALKSILGGIGFAYVASDILKTNIAMEQLHARLEAIMGSANVAAQAFNNILQVAKETPQSVEEISKSFIMLKNFGIEPTMQVMQDLTNMTSRLGGQSDTLSGITLALGQAFAKGKLQAQDTNQMIERGVPVYKLLGEVTGKTSSEILKMMEAGELTHPIIEKLIHAMGSDSVGASSKMMATLGGQINMLGDAWHRFETALLNDQSQGLIKNIISNISGMLDWLSSKMENQIDSQIKHAQLKINAMKQNGFFGGLIDDIVGNDIQKEQNKIASLQKQKSVVRIDGDKYAKDMADTKKIQTQADIDAKAKALQIKKVNEFGTAQEKETQAIKEAKAEYGELTKSMTDQIHAKFFHKEMTHAATAAHKAESAAQREANNAAKEHAQIIEKFNGKDPYKNYAKSMAELSSVQKDLSPETFLLNQQKIATEFEKNTVDLKAYNDELERHKKYVNNVGDYNSLVTESQNNLSRGAITPQEHGLNVANANAGLMNDASSAFPNAKIPNIPASKVGEVIDKKNINDSAKELAKFTEESNKAITALDSFGNSGKMAFDGILGGISAVASAATSFGDEMSKLNNSHTAYAENYNKFVADSKNTEADKADATKQFAKEKDAFNKKSFETEINGAMSIAGATAKMFNQKSVAARAFHGIEMGLAVVSMAMSAKKMIVDIAAGAAAMFGQSGWAGFAGVAAMGAVMAGLGVAMTGGSGKTIDNTAPATKAEGTVLGSPTATSNSIENIIKTLNDIHAQEYPELKAMADNFKGVDRDLYQMQRDIARSTANFTNMQGMGIPASPTGAGKSQNPLGSTGTIAANLGASVALGATGALSTAGLYAGAALINAGATSIGIGISTAAASSATLAATTGAALGATGATATLVGGAILGLAGGLVLAGLQYGLGKLLGIGKVKYQQIGEGIVIESGKLIQDGMVTAVDAQTWRKDIKTIKGWFSNKKSVVETYGQLSDDIYNSLSSMTSNLTYGMIAAAQQLGALDALSYKFTDVSSRPSLKIDFWKDGKRVDDTNKVLSDQINAWMDRTATNVFGTLFGEFQKLGEGMMETVSRLAGEVAVVKGAFAKMHLSVGDSNLGLVTFSDTLVQMYASSAKADDGLKNFVASMNDLYSFTMSKGQQGQDSIDKGKSYLETMTGGKGFNIYDTDLVKSTTLNITKQIADAQAKTTAAEAAVKSMTPAVKDYWNPQASTSMSSMLEDTAKGYSTNSSWLGALGVTAKEGVDSAMWSNVPDAWKNIFKTAQSNPELANHPWSKAAYILDEKAAIKSAGAAKGGNTQTIEQNAAALAAAQQASTDAAAEVVKLTSSLTYLKESASTTSTLLATQSKYIDLTQTAAEKTERERKDFIKENLQGLTDNLNQPLYYDTFKPILTAMGVLGTSAAVYAKDLQNYVWRIEDTAKAVKLLADASKYLDNFSHSIKTWVQNMKATQLGSPESQLSASSKNFAEQMQIIKGGLAYSGEEKQAALSGITSVADTYIQSLKNYYGSGIEAQAKIQEVVDGVSGLGNIVDVASLQLGVLQQIREGVNTLPTGITAGLETTFFTNLATAINTAQKNYQTTPTAQNDLIANTLAKEWTLAVSAVSKGSGFLDAFISSFDGDTGLNTAVKLIFDNKTIDSVQAQAVIDKTLNALDTSKLNFKGDKLLSPNFSTRAQSAIDAEVAKLKIEPLKLDANAKPVTTTITGLFSGGNLTGFNDKSYIATLDVNKQAVNDGLAATTPLLTDFSKINAVATIGLNGASATVESFDSITSAAQRTQDAMAATSSIQAFAIAENARIAAERQAAIDKQNQDASIALYKAAADKRIAQNAADKAAGLVTLDAKYKTSLGSSGILSKSKIEASDISLLTTLAQNALLSAGKSIAGITEASMQSMKYVNGALSANFNTGGAFAQSINIVDAPKVYDKISAANTFPKFAKGGISNQPSIFGEAGAEAAVPLPDGRSIPVSFNRPAANDSSTDNKETIEELKAQNRQLSATLEVLQAGFNQLLEESKKQTESLDGIERKARLRKAA